MYISRYRFLIIGILCAVAGMVTLQNLQNLANLQNLPQVASLAAGLQGMTAGLTNNQLINTPLNLTVSSSGKKHKSNSLHESKNVSDYARSERRIKDQEIVDKSNLTR